MKLKDHNYSLLFKGYTKQEWALKFNLTWNASNNNPQSQTQTLSPIQTTLHLSLSLCKLRLNKNGNWEEEVDVIGAMEGRRGSHGRVPRREAQSHKAAAWSRVSDARASQEERQVQTPRP